jgi:hypothetical protein
MIASRHENLTVGIRIKRGLDRGIIGHGGLRGVPAKQPY